MVFTGRCLARRRPARVYRRTVIRAVAGFGEPIELSGGVRVTATHPPDQAARHTKVALSAVQAHRGTEGSDRSPSTRESKAFATLAIALLAVAGAYTLGAAAVAFAAW